MLKVGAVALACLFASSSAMSDFLPKSYHIVLIKGEFKLFAGVRQACDAMVSAKSGGIPAYRYQITSIEKIGYNIGSNDERNNEASFICFDNVDEQYPDGSWVRNSNGVGVASGDVRAYCPHEIDYSIPETARTYAKFWAKYDKYTAVHGYPMESVYNTNGNKLKTCHCRGASEGASWKQVGNSCEPEAENTKSTSEDKDTPDNSGVCSIGNPVNPATGAKYLHEQDYLGHGAGLPLKFERTYNSQVEPISPTVGLGWGWRHNFNRALVVDAADALPRIRVIRPNGGAVVFQQQADGSYTQDADTNDRLEAVKDGSGMITGYRFTVAEGAEGVGVVESYDAEGFIQGLKTLGGWTQTFIWSNASTPVEDAPSLGFLMSVMDSSGRSLQFKYNNGGQLRQVIDSAGGVYDFAYDDIDNLISVTNPKLEVRTYHYNEADHIQDETGMYGAAGAQAHLTHALTGITDEASKRYADYRYQYDGRGIETAHAGGAEKHTLSYNADGSTTVVDPLTQSRVYKFAVAQGVAQPQDQDQPCSTGSPYKSTKVDANGNPEYQIDFNGNRTSFVYDTVRNLETSRKEGLKADGTVTAETRTITTEWHPSLRQPAKIAQPLKLTSFEYYPSGLLKTRTERATTDKDGSKGVSATLDAAVLARVWSYTYNTEGQVLAVDGPRLDADVKDITTLTYYTSTDTAEPPKWRKGDVQTVKNAAGHITTFNEYDAHGNVLKSTDANNLVTQNAYDELGRLKTQTVGGLSTSYTYDPRGMPESVSTPQGQKLTYAYDNAHRLKTITDRDGNRIEYTELDAMGTRRDERVYDAANKLVRQHKRQYNALNRLEQDIGATNPLKQITKYEYYLGGQVQKVTDPLARVTEHTYDALNRLKDSTLPVPLTGVARPVVKYGWDGQDRLANVTDPRLLQTSYTIDGLGNRTAVSSPDAGAQSYTPDEAGNIKTAKDAKLQTTGYTYDALNRVKTVSFHDGSTQVYEYDTAANGKGKLAKITEKDAQGSVVTTLDVGYDSLGRVNKQTRVLAGQSLVTQYGYDASGRLETVTYPSTRKVTYSYDASGRVSGVKTTPAGGTEVAVISSVSYHPFGGVKQYTYGNGQVQVLDQDQDGRAKGYALGGVGSYALDYDDAGQIQTIRHATDLAQMTSYGWDGLSRLSSATLPAASYGYTYDGVGNRTKATVGAGSTTYSYDPAKNWLTGIGAKTQGFDANGALQTSQAGIFTHDVRGRLSKLVGTSGTTTYGVDALGLRVRKSNAQGDVLYAYDADGNLLAEATAAGTVVKEYIYMGSRPVAVIAQ